MTLGGIGEFERVLGCEVRKRVHLEVSPSGFHGVEFRRVGRKEFDVEVARPVKHPDHWPTSMHVEPVPHEKDGTLDLTPEVSNELGQPYAVDVATGPDGKVERDPTSPRRHRQRSDNRGLFSVASRLRKNRCLASRGPGPAHERCEEKPALIKENDVCVQSPRFFLMRGQSTLIQRRIAASSRSRAWRSGFCGVQPNDRRTRPK
jgi:hypothetical protein